MAEVVKLMPLDGSPLMSDNCWGAICETLRERAKAGTKVRYLEWGAGNSTLGVLQLAITEGKPFEIVSVEHDTAFFPFLADSLIAEARTHGEVKVAWRPLAQPAFSFSHLPRLRADKHLVSSPLRWVVAWGNNRIGWIEGFRPRFGFPLLQMPKRLAKLALVELAYWWWILRGVLRGVVVDHGLRGANAAPYVLDIEQVLDLSRVSFTGIFHGAPGALTLTAGPVTTTLWHLPQLKNLFWRKGLLVDGSVAQLPAFVGVPLEGTFDAILVDGRARVPCIMRVARDRLVAKGGRFFVHDAFRAEMAEGFRLFSPTFSFINGSNRMKNGTIRVGDDYGPPLTYSGATLASRERHIAGELFVWENVENEEAAPEAR
jgi:hypothetical protein